MSKLLKCSIEEAWTLRFGVTENIEIFCESKGDGSQSELQEGKEENVRKWRRHSRENLRKERTKRKAGF